MRVSWWAFVVLGSLLASAAANAQQGTGDPYFHSPARPANQPGRFSSASSVLRSEPTSGAAAAGPWHRASTLRVPSAPSTPPYNGSLPYHSPISQRYPGMGSSVMRPTLLRMPAVDAASWQGSSQNSAAQPGAQQPSSQQANSQPSGDAGTQRDPIGQAPADDSQLFLRTATVLLDRGELQFDLGFTYAWQENMNIAVLQGGTVSVQRSRVRQFLAPMNVRYGLTDRLEGFGVLAVGMTRLETFAGNTETTTTGGPLGDTVIGFKYLWIKSEKETPDVVLSMTSTLPTGTASDVTTAGLGRGFWALSAGMNVIKAYDPIVLFAGARYTHEFDEPVAGVNVNPGELIDYSMGLGLAVNEDMTLSAELLGAYQNRTNIGGVVLAGTAIEPLSLRVALIRRTSTETFVEPFVRFGLNDDAADVQFGVFFTSTYGSKKDDDDQQDNDQ